MIVDDCEYSSDLYFVDNYGLKEYIETYIH